MLGISVGSLNGAGFSLFPKGEEKKSVDLLMNIWTTVEKGNFMKNWKYWWFTAIYNKRGCYDDSPAREFLHNLMEGHDSFKRDFTIGVCDANTGISNPNNSNINI